MRSQNTEKNDEMILSIVSSLLPEDGLSLEVFPDFQLAALKTLIAEEIMHQITPDKMFLYRDGHLLADGEKTLQEHGLVDHAVLELHTRESIQALRQAHRVAASGPAEGARNTGGDFMTDSEVIRLRLLGDQNMMSQLREQQPELAEAVNDPQRFSQIFQMLESRRRDAEREKQHEIARLNDDPFNIDSQRRIEELIREEAVRENLQNALEYNPESFGRVTMLYVPVEVNGHPVKAFVDSGAQATIMSPKCAEDCNIMRLIDRRFAGIAKGVGTAKILGRVHSAQIKLGDQYLPCSFTVMEGKDVDLLLGLDMLKRHQASINLKDNLLEFGETKIPFLPENECPRSFDAPGQEDEPVVEGPAGSLVGGQSGAMIRPPAVNPNFQGPGHSVGGPSTSESSASAPQPLLSQTTIPSPVPTPVNPPPLPSGRQTHHAPEKIEQLTSLGFSETEARQALNTANGDVELAASLLFG
ncbi:DNA damage-inducible protein 1 [Orbilia oligospora]|uniref:DNA damage-inducible protein 1 n=1 Tax=Orbilia oligospora TaxID=2813651 RepID=A0A7C8KIS0_ORBOL|nr:DNA damage-inducible protein 1 [Orbilia oligospora]KAF3200897.1 DNA damage-inducible protein 1 [Orbilia oligospora]